MIQAFFANPFLLMALFAGLAASVTSGVMGSFIVVRRIVFIAGSIAHSVLGGMGFFLWLERTYNIAWLSPLQGAVVAALASALIIGWIHIRYREREDTVIAALWSTGMAVGVIFVSLTPGYNVELLHYLFGNILWVTKSDLWMLLILDVIVVGIVAFFRHQFVAICFDEQQAKIQNVPVRFFYMLLLCLIALSVVILIQVVGAILVIAMLAIPAAIATRMTHNFLKLLLLAVLIGGALTTIGIAASYQLNWPPGATIALVSALVYIVQFLLMRRQTIR